MLRFGGFGLYLTVQASVSGCMGAYAFSGGFGWVGVLGHAFKEPRTFVSYADI